MYGTKFVYGEANLTEREVRVARCRTEAGVRERDLARRFAASAKKPVKENLTSVELGSRVARCRAEAAVRERNSARRCAAKKREKQDSSVKVTNKVELSVVHLDHQDVAPIVRRSLHIARKFYDRLAGSGDFSVEYLEGHYSVKIFRDDKKKTWHIKGLKDNVLPCFTAILELITEWRRREAVD